MSNFEYPAYPILALIAAVLVVVPFPWHLQAWNSGTCLFMIWTSLGCLNYAVNAIVWRADVFDRAPVWCDICKLSQSSSTYLILNAVLSFTCHCCCWGCHSRCLFMH